MLCCMPLSLSSIFLGGLRGFSFPTLVNFPKTKGFKVALGISCLSGASNAAQPGISLRGSEGWWCVTA